MTRRHLLSARDLDAATARALLTLAVERRDHPHEAAARPLLGRSLATVFFENSTRTRVSFTLAAARAGMHTVDLSAAASSVHKGETLVDTAKTVDAMGVDAIAVRTGQAGGAALVAQHVSASVLNAGDGKHEHPTQALADALALGEAAGREGFDLDGLRVAIVGDVVSSRVARSSARLLTTLGAAVVLVGPPAMAPKSLGEAVGVRVAHDLDAELESADAVMMLRIQLERGAGAWLASARAYRAGHGLTAARAARMKDGAFVMHPGPSNRGLEIDPEVADGPRSLIQAQVSAGVAVRTAALEWCLGA